MFIKAIDNNEDIYDCMKEKCSIVDKMNNYKNLHRSCIKWQMVFYDAILLAIVSIALIGIYPSEILKLPDFDAFTQILISMFCILGSRALFKSYHQVWRYARTSNYIHLMLCDFVGGVSFFVIQKVLPVQDITFVRALSNVSLDLLLAIAVRLLYQYIYEYSTRKNTMNNSFLRKVVAVLTGLNIDNEMAATQVQIHRINIAIVGAGRVGVMLAEELLNNPNATYIPKCFIDVDQGKVGRYINGIQVLSEDEATLERLSDLPVQEIVFAIPDASAEKKKKLYENYKMTGCKLKVYDYPITQAVTASGNRGKRHLREFDIEELLFRDAKDFTNDVTKNYYKNKVVLISGGGGSIGSELSRQIAKIGPKQLIILDVYENSAYDIQQELKIAYGNRLDLRVEIVSICDMPQLKLVFQKYHPDIVLHAAAHKHVPLMEHNCCEAVKNNVFGTLNIVEASEMFGVKKFMMISTDKAVNPTNVMGATKRMCEMIVQSRTSSTSFSATRFGNVLGSNGSVIPLFKRQIANGGPITLTDRRIIRYFMTIPEASQLVLASGAMAKNGELYVLDMGKPVKILELAENMIRLSGYEPYKDIDIIETGLRPGEKLYEELLIKTEHLNKTDNSMIFIEKDTPLSESEMAQKLDILRVAVATNNDDIVRDAMKRVIPTYHAPEEINENAVDAEEMKDAREIIIV